MLMNLYYVRGGTSVRSMQPKAPFGSETVKEREGKNEKKMKYKF